MKRPPRRILIGAALIVGLLGAFSISTYRRAQRLLREELENAEQVLATFPDQSTCRPALFEPPEDGNAWDLEVEVIRELIFPDPFASSGPDPHPYDRDRHPGGLESFIVPQKAVLVESHVDVLRRAFRRTIVRPRERPGDSACQAADRVARSLIDRARVLHGEGKDFPAAERLVLAIGLVQDVARNGDTLHLRYLHRTERLGAWVAWNILSAYSLSARELETWAGWMDRLHAARPALASIIETDSAWSRKDVVEDYRNCSVYSATVPPSVTPTWRDLWTETLAKCRSVLEIHRTSRALEEVARRPPEEWSGATFSKENPSNWDVPSPKILEVDGVHQLERLLWRVSIALAWYSAEHGALPKGLQELSPRYLPREPHSPWTGAPLDYQAGQLGPPRQPGSGETSRILGDAVLDLQWQVGPQSP